MTAPPTTIAQPRGVSFDAIDDDQLALARDRLAASAAYRDALDALGAARG